MKTITLATALMFVSALAALAQHAPGSMEEHSAGSMAPHESHSTVAPVTYAELKSTVALLERAMRRVDTLWSESFIS